MMHMAKPFERFASELNWQQVSLLLDTVQYFEDAPKLLSIPDRQGTSIPVPMTADTLRALLAVLDENKPMDKRVFVFDWQEGSQGESDLLVVELPDGSTVRQPTDYQAFSPV
jgi:hypothetical protein